MFFLVILLKKGLQSFKFLFQILFFVSRNVKFYEYVFPFKLKSSVVDKYSHSVDPSDLFSYNEPLISSWLQEKFSLGDLGVTPQSDGVGAVHSLDPYQWGQQPQWRGTCIKPGYEIKIILHQT